ncbi:hypothetical protein [Streptomyces zaomyceticus]|uniref:hypothetical protein n=1 Tax=Streptomyces zaomyceticus TaxID=68286 RepID=UPI002E21540D
MTTSQGFDPDELRTAFRRALETAPAHETAPQETGANYVTYRSFLRRHRVRSEGQLAGRHLHQLRRRLNHSGLARAAEGTRAPRVALYVRTFHGEDPAPVFAQLRNEAARRGWAVSRMFHDQLPFGQNANALPDEWPGWVAVRDQIKTGYADGVLVENRHHISSDAPSYITELEYIGHRTCFTWLLHPESDP